MWIRENLLQVAGDAQGQTMLGGVISSPAWLTQSPFCSQLCLRGKEAGAAETEEQQYLEEEL